MLRVDAERLFGAPVDESRRTEGTLTVATLVFIRGADRITAEFVEDVLIRFVIGRTREAQACGEISRSMPSALPISPA